MPWLELCRGIVEDVRGELERMPTREEREKVLGQGRGGDETTQIDAAAEQAAVNRLEALDVPGFTLVSEELGERVFGTGGPLRVVLDPIDGSINAKRGIPFFSVSLAVAAGQLLVREVGLAIEFVDGGSFSDSELDLESRSRIAAAGTEELCRALSERLRD